MAGSGTETLLSSGFYNTLSGASGADTLSTSGSFDTLISGTGTDTLVSSGTDTTLIGGGEADLLTSSGNGNILIAEGSANSLVSTGTGDTLLGNGAGSTLDGTAGSQAIAAYALDDVTVNLDTGAADQNGTGETDVLIGISSADVFGDADTIAGGTGLEELLASGTGDAVIGGSSSDHLLADGVDDTLIGQANGSTLVAANGGATVAAYLGNDIIINLANGTAGVGGTYDTLIGVSIASALGSADTLTGGAAADTLFSDAAGNKLVGGTGVATAAYDLDNVTVNLLTDKASLNGSGVSDTLTSISSALVAGDDDTIIGSSASDSLTASGENDTLIAGSGAAVLIATGQNDSLIGTGHGDTLIGVSGTGAIAAYKTANAVVNLEDGTATINGSETSDTLSGITEAAGLAANDTLIGGEGDTTLFGSVAGDTLEGGPGTTVASYASNDLAINLGAGTAMLAGGGASDTLIGITDGAVSGTDDTVTSDSGSDVLYSTGSDNTLIGGSGADTLSTSGTGDTLVAGSGSSTLLATGTGAYYDFGTDSSTASILNGASGATSAANTLDFGAGTNDEDLWFVQAGNDLDIDLVGTTKAVTVENWFSNGGAQLSEISADGLELDSQFNQLISAMATYEAANPAFNAQTATAMPTDTSLQSVIANSWHS